MLYTPSHAELAQHPKTRKLARLLGVPIPTAIGHLHLLWHFALKYAPDGELSRFDWDDIENGVMWEGTPDEFCAQCIAAGWLDLDDVTEVLSIHDWDEYGGKYITRKEANAQRMRETRAKQQPDTTTPRATHVQRTSSARAHLEERRGEESKEEEKKGERTVRAARATPAPDVFPISDEMRTWAETNAPGVDITSETDRFLNRNRAKGTTYKDWHAAWKNWMTSPYAKAPPPSPARPVQPVNGRAPGRPGGDLTSSLAFLKQRQGAS
jgi:hypothetical protein